MILLRILLRILIGFYKDFTNFYGFLKKMVQKNQYTYNVPPGPSDYIYNEAWWAEAPEGTLQNRAQWGPFDTLSILLWLETGVWHFQFTSGN